MGMSSFKLAVRNVRRSVRDYTVYFMTLMISVAIFYIFNAMDSQSLVSMLGGVQQQMIELLVEMMSIVSVVVSVILTCLIIYANSYLVRRRKKELGIYMLLGMPKRRISTILATETTLIGLLSLGVGLALGVLLSQGLSMVVAEMFRVKLRMYTFIFSAAALWKTVIYFGISFVLVMIFNIFTVSKCKLIDLLTAERKNQSIKMRKLWLCVVLFLLSLAILGAAYYLIIQTGMLMLNGMFGLCILMGVVGTLLFFMSLSGFLLRVLKSRKKWYLKNLNMFVLRQVNSKVNTAFISLAIICIMVFFAITILATASGFNVAMTAELEETLPYDATLRVSYDEDAGDASFEERMKTSDVDLERDFAAWHQYEYRKTGVRLKDVFRNPGEYADKVAKFGELTAISISDYNALRAMRGDAPMELGEAEYLLLVRMSSAEGMANAFAAGAGAEMEIAGSRLRLDTPPFTESLEIQMYFTDGMTTVVPDAVFEKLEPMLTLINGNFDPGRKEDLEMLYSEKFYADEDYDYKTCLWGGVAYDVYANALGSRTMVLFVLLYLGVVLLIVAAAILALQQLSEAADNASRYKILAKIGAGRHMIKSSLLRQIAIYFLIPLALAIVHSVVGIYVVVDALRTMGEINALGNILLSAGIVLGVYLLYFLATYSGCKRSVMGEIGNIV